MFSVHPAYETTPAFLKEPLQEFINTLEKVHLYRAHKREGLIRARLMGTSVARGDVLVFMDAHCECTEGKIATTLMYIFVYYMLICLTSWCRPYLV